MHRFSEGDYWLWIKWVEGNPRLLISQDILMLIERMMDYNEKGVIPHPGGPAVINNWLSKIHSCSIPQCVSCNGEWKLGFFHFQDHFLKAKMSLSISYSLL